MHRTVLVALVALVALAGAGGTALADASAAQEDDVTIELSVTTPGGDPIADAEATVEWDGGSETVETRSNGRALVDVPDGAELEITLTHADYVKNGPHVVESTSANQIVETTMFEPATADVTVVDTEGAPVEGATVRLRKDGQSMIAASGNTDSEGLFASDEVETGTYDVMVRQPGYYRVTETVEVSGEVQTEIEIEEGEVTVDLNVQDPTPEGPGSVSADVDVSLDGERVVSATTSDQGRRSVVLEVNRDYDITVSKESYLELTTSLRIGESNTNATFNITRTPTISMTAGNERVVVGENLRVEVTDEYDRPVEGATVTVDGDAAGETDADGVARVEIPSEGDVEVVAEFEGMRTDAVTVVGITESAGDDGGNVSDEDEDDDGGTGDGSPGFGVVAALLGALVAIAALARRN